MPSYYLNPVTTARGLFVTNGNVKMIASYTTTENGKKVSHRAVVWTRYSDVKRLALGNPNEIVRAELELTPDGQDSHYNIPAFKAERVDVKWRSDRKPRPEQLPLF